LVQSPNAALKAIPLNVMAFSLKKLVEHISGPPPGVAIGSPFLSEPADAETIAGELDQLAAKPRQRSLELHLVPNPFEALEDFTGFLSRLGNCLEKGGSLYGHLDSTHTNQRYNKAYAKYGFQKEVGHPLKVGEKIYYTEQDPESKHPSLYLDEGSIAEVFGQAGFLEFQFFGPWISPELVKAWPDGYWDTLMEEPPFLSFCAKFTLG
jgi:hypothetical protein